MGSSGTLIDSLSWEHNDRLENPGRVARPSSEFIWSGDSFKDFSSFQKFVLKIFRIAFTEVSSLVVFRITWPSECYSNNESFSRCNKIKIFFFVADAISVIQRWLINGLQIGYHNQWDEYNWICFSIHTFIVWRFLKIRFSEMNSTRWVETFERKNWLNR